MSAPIDPFRGHVRNLQALLEDAPRLGELLGESGEIGGRAAVASRLEALERQGGEPVLVATLYGPTGAGKSTLFRALTGIDVPAGGAVRPVSYSCAAAVPHSVATPERLAAILPGFDVLPLADPALLKDPEQPRSRLFVATYAAGDGLPLVVADVPDFNSVAEANWQRAEAVLQRAELVVFLATAETYADRKVVEVLQRCCGLAGRLVFVLTKMDETDAREIWQDLTTKKLAPGGPFAFAETRADGRTLLEFLAASDVYYAPRAEALTLAGVLPLAERTPAFESLLRGTDAAQVLLAGLLEPARLFVQSSKRLLRDRDRQLAEAAECLGRAESRVLPEAARVVEHEFPLSDVMRIVHEECTREQGFFARALSTPAWLLGSAVKAIRGAAGRLWDGVRAAASGAAGEGDAYRREDLELKRLREGVESLTDTWRVMFPEAATAGGPLGTGPCDRARAAALARLPPAGDRWEAGVREAARTWVAENPAWSKVLPAVSDALVLAGGAAIVLDLVTTGGLVGTLGAAAAAGGGAALAGQFAHFVTSWRLEKVVQAADAAWREQRREEFNAYLTEALYRPLFAPWLDARARLADFPADRVAAACAALEAASASLAKSSR